MRVVFAYSQEKDVWCLLNYGKTSMNSTTPTKMYEQLIATSGDNPSEEKVVSFIDTYTKDNDIDMNRLCDQYQKDWDSIADTYKKIAENVFKTSLFDDVTAYLTINNRCPYSILDNLFFVQAPAYSMRKTVMHELWHFYTWQIFGKTWEEKLGKQKYNELKEALTVLLNILCKDLLPKGILDTGYPQHKELREKIVQLWEEEKDIEKVWIKIAV